MSVMEDNNSFRFDSVDLATLNLSLQNLPLPLIRDALTLQPGGPFVDLEQLSFGT